jgi:hypothetical protein
VPKKSARLGNRQGTAEAEALMLLDFLPTRTPAARQHKLAPDTQRRKKLGLAET